MRRLIAPLAALGLALVALLPLMGVTASTQPWSPIAVGLPPRLGRVSHAQPGSAAGGGPVSRRRGLVYNLETGQVGALPAHLHVAPTSTSFGCGRLRVDVTQVVGTQPTLLKEWVLQVRGGSPRLHLSDRVAYATSPVVAGTEGHPGTPWAAMIVTSPTGQLTVTREGRQARVTYPVLYSFAEVYRQHEGWSAGCVRERRGEEIG